MLKNTLSIMAFIASMGLAEAQEIAVGLGLTDPTFPALNGAAVSLDYRAKPFAERRVASFAFAASATLTEFGDAFVGAGLSTRWTWDSGWFLENQFTPGVTAHGTQENDLGSTFTFRSHLAVGYSFKNDRVLSLAFSHTSNAGLGDTNPGVNMVFLRYHVGF